MQTMNTTILLQSKTTTLLPTMTTMTTATAEQPIRAASHNHNPPKPLAPTTHTSPATSHSSSILPNQTPNKTNTSNHCTHTPFQPQPAPTSDSTIHCTNLAGTIQRNKIVWRLARSPPAQAQANAPAQTPPQRPSIQRHRHRSRSQPTTRVSRADAGSNRQLNAERDISNTLPPYPRHPTQNQRADATISSPICPTPPAMV